MVVNKKPARWILTAILLAILVLIIDLWLGHRR